MTKFKLDTAELFVPDGLKAQAALARTTHMAVGAHQDDLEIMAIEGILRCFRREGQWFTGVTVTNGRGWSPRDDLYQDYTDEEMRATRNAEQKTAAMIGEYAAQVLLDYPSSAVKDSSNNNVMDDIIQLLQATRPQIVYTHNLADKHDTHVAVALKVIQAIRSLAPTERPRRLYGCEVWRDLDWMVDQDKVALDCSTHKSLQAALLGVFDSQISGGKRYDLASLGRRRANATYHTTHDTDVSTSLSFAMDLTPLIQNQDKDVRLYVQEFVNRFAQDVYERLDRL